MNGSGGNGKRVAMLCTADLRGGAAIVTYRLMEALRSEGVDARMVVAEKLSQSPWVSTVSERRFKVAKVAERGEIFLRNDFDRHDLWKVSTARFGCGITSHPWVREADVVILSWVNQGLVSLADLRRLHRMGKRLIWVMHDMWCATGICHHATNCRAYTATCCGCPLLHNHHPDRRDLSTAVQRRKAALYAQVPITFVPVSNWLADRCRESTLLRNAPLVTIHNPFPVGNFTPTPTLTREQLGLPADAPLILFAAARLDDPIKNLPLTIATLNRFAPNAALPGAASTVGTVPSAIARGSESSPSPVAIFCGALRNPQALEGLRIPYLHLGSVTDPARMAAIFAHASAVLSTSVRETLPGTLIEGMAAGATPVTTGHGGQPDIIDHGIDGYIAPPSTPIAELPALLASYLLQAITHPFPREAQHEAVVRRFNPATIARRFMQLMH